MRPVNRPDWTLNTTHLAELFGVRPQRIAVLVQEGMPKLARGKYDARERIRWRHRRASGAKVPASIQEARRLLYEEQAEHKCLESAQPAPTLVEVDDTRSSSAWAYASAAVAGMLPEPSLGVMCKPCLRSTL